MFYPASSKILFCETGSLVGIDNGMSNQGWYAKKRESVQGENSSLDITSPSGVLNFFFLALVN